MRRGERYTLGGSDGFPNFFFFCSGVLAGCWVLGPGAWGGGVGGFFFSKSEEVRFSEYFHAGLMAFYLHTDEN